MSFVVKVVCGKSV
ncbi:hypothetical protein M2H13_22340 [Vibrio vulnificus]|nr:hypothetical protein [Vibrio vulnificus]MCU8448370.1 hypothetical protein [Vibrio vulnificus]MCU8566684.1 hypothetical protein [Vibrio vulnificus]